jgi:hypothetical protein
MRVLLHVDGVPVRGVGDGKDEVKEGFVLFRCARLAGQREGSKRRKTRRTVLV